MNIPTLVQSDAQPELTFRDTEFHGRIHNFAVSEDFQTAVTVSRYGTYEIMVYEDTVFSYAIWTNFSRSAPAVTFEGRTLYILHGDTVIAVTEPGSCQAYRYADPAEGVRFLEDHPGENRGAVIEVGDRRYDLEKGNLLYSTGDSEGTFYVTDEGTVPLPGLIAVLLLSIPLGVWMYRTFMKQYRSVHPKRETD